MSVSHNKQGGDSFPAGDARMAFPFVPPSKRLCTGTHQPFDNHEARSLSTGPFTKEADRSTFLSSVTLSIKEGFKSTMRLILLQLTYGEMRTD